MFSDLIPVQTPRGGDWIGKPFCYLTGGANMSDPSPAFGDTVRIKASPVTTERNLAGLRGTVYGETTPSVTGVEVIGYEGADYAINVMIESTREAHWFAPHLVEFVDHAVGTEIRIGDHRMVRQADGEWKKAEADPPFSPGQPGSARGAQANAADREYVGIYVAHWEVARLVVSKGTRFFGLIQKVEFWHPVFPEGFVLPGMDNTRSMREQCGYYRMKLRGELGPRGYFGHKGICRHQLRVTEVVHCEKTESPGKTW